jgi:3-methyladenine DNA glycosylase Tag
MQANQAFNPGSVYEIVRSNPQLMSMVENVAKLNQMQQAAAQMAPYVNQFAQNPGQMIQQAGNWAQNAVNQANAENQSQAAANENQQQPPAGQPNDMMSMAMGIIEEFRGYFNTINNNLEEIHKMVETHGKTIKKMEKGEKNVSTTPKKADEQ